MSLSLKHLLNTRINSKSRNMSNSKLLNAFLQHFINPSDNSDVAETQKSVNILEDKTIFPEFKSGPLKVYREKASFCYKRMNVLLEGEEHIRLKVSTKLLTEILLKKIHKLKNKVQFVIVWVLKVQLKTSTANNLINLSGR